MDWFYWFLDTLVKPHLRADISVNRNQSELFELQIGADVTHYRTKESERTPANFQQGKL